MAKNKKSEDWLLGKLKDHDQAVAYLNDALEKVSKVMKSLNNFFSLLYAMSQKPKVGLGR